MRSCGDVLLRLCALCIVDGKGKASPHRPKLDPFVPVVDQIPEGDKSK